MRQLTKNLPATRVKVLPSIRPLTRLAPFYLQRCSAQFKISVIESTFVVANFNFFFKALS